MKGKGWADLARRLADKALPDLQEQPIRKGIPIIVLYST